MIAVDTTVALAALSRWHPHHVAAAAAIGDTPSLPAHCGAELYSTLTRLPDPYRLRPAAAAEAIGNAYAGHWLLPSAELMESLPAMLASLRIAGGAVYDALVAVTVREHGATLVSLDRRAEATYRATGVDFELIGT